MTVPFQPTAKEYMYIQHCRREWQSKLDDVMSEWLELLVPLPRDNRLYAKFNKFMGWKSGRYFTVDLENPVVQQTIDFLHGPHCKTLLKVIELRKEEANG